MTEIQQAGERPFKPGDTVWTEDAARKGKVVEFRPANEEYVDCVLVDFGGGEPELMEADEVTSEKPRWIICVVCDGDGSTVNPAIDGNGLSAEDFYDDPDFADEYMRGTYDIACRACGGSGKMLHTAPARLAEAAADRRLRAQEDGDFEGYCHASDYRYGY